MIYIFKSGEMARIVFQDEHYKQPKLPAYAEMEFIINQDMCKVWMLKLVKI